MFQRKCTFYLELFGKCGIFSYFLSLGETLQQCLDQRFIFHLIKQTFWEIIQI